MLSVPPWFLYYIILTPPTQHLCLEDDGMWRLTGLENSKQMVLKGLAWLVTSLLVLVVESLCDMSPDLGKPTFWAHVPDGIKSTVSPRRKKLYVSNFIARKLNSCFIKMLFIPLKNPCTASLW